MKTQSALRPALLLAATLLAGCRRQSAPDPTAAAPATDTPEAAAPDPAAAPADPAAKPEAKVGAVAALKQLSETAADPYVKNNAKAAVDAWNQGQYGDAVVFLRTAVSLPAAAAYGPQITAALTAMTSELKQAAARGNSAAKDALGQLGSGQ